MEMGSKPAETPGVGEYDIAHTKRTGTGLAFTMAGKHGPSALEGRCDLVPPKI